MSKALDLLNSLESPAVAEANKGNSMPKHHKTHPAKHMKSWKMPGAKPVKEEIEPQLYTYQVPAEMREKIAEALVQKLGEDVEVEMPGEEGEEDMIHVMSREDVEEIVCMVLKELGLIEDDDQDDDDMGGNNPDQDNGEEGGQGGAMAGESNEAKKGKKGFMNKKAPTMGKGNQKGGKKHLPEALQTVEVNNDEELVEHRNGPAATSRILGFMERMGK